MPEAEFWELTPCQFFSLVDYSNIKQLQDDYRIGSLIELVHNALAKKPRKWLEWFPQHKTLIAKINNKKAARPISEKEARLQARLMSAKFKLAEKATQHGK